MGFTISNAEEEKMTDLYVKSKSGRYLPVKFSKIVTKNWEDCIVLVKVGNKQRPATLKDEEGVFEALCECKFTNIEDKVNFIITSKDINFKNLGIKEHVRERLIKGDDVLDIITEEA